MNTTKKAIAGITSIKSEKKYANTENIVSIIILYDRIFYTLLLLHKTSQKL